MPTSIIVVDDFFADARGFREAGLELAYPDQTGSLFPGRNSADRLEIPGLDAHVSQFVGERLKPLPPPAGHGRFRLTLASDVGRAGVHVDPGYWSGILYLFLRAGLSRRTHGARFPGSTSPASVQATSRPAGSRLRWKYAGASTAKRLPSTGTR